MEIINIVLTAIGKAIALIILFGTILTGTAPGTALLPSQKVATTTTTTPQAVAKPISTKAAVKPTEQKSGLSASGVLAETGDLRTFGQEVLPKLTQPTKSQEQINIETRAALVNILCNPTVGISGISGSGVVIDSRGIILTNAHIGQYFLLRDYITPGNTICSVRIGSPAQERYTATLLYLPPAWVSANASQLVALQATGTGENDYAFLLITGRTDPTAALPDSFDRLEMDRGYVDIGDPMLLAAYPAGFLSSQLVQKNLYASSAVTYVTQLFSFDGTKRVDLFSIGGTVVSQGGSSGGAAVRLSDGKLAGIITTETTAAATSGRDLRAVSLAHIDDSLAASGQGGIIPLLSGDLSAKAAEFNTKIAPTETTILEAALEAALKGN